MDNLSQFLVEKDGQPRLIISNGDLPHFLISADAAVESGRMDEAIHILNDQEVEAVRHMVEHNPSRTDVMFALAVVLHKTGQLHQAEEWYEKILEIEPHALVLHELGRVCWGTGRLSEAIRYQRKAIEAWPNNERLLDRLAEYLMRTGKTQEGIGTLRKAVEKAPGNAKIHSNLLLTLHYLPEPDRQMIFDEHKRWGRIHSLPGRARTSHTNSPDPDRRIRIGYISPDFNMHPVAYFFEPLLEGHDREVVEVYGYGNVHFPDQTTERLKRKFDHYRNVWQLGDDALARMIEKDGIDILIDLAGHSGNNRLSMLAHKPAPVQVTYLGYPDTTGLETIDYFLTDELADPPQSQRFYTEELIFLTNGFLCYEPSDFAPPVTSLPAERKGYITFGSFNTNLKLNPYIMSLWAQVLRANDSSRLLLKFRGGGDEEVRNHYLDQFEQLGISRERVQICGFDPLIEYLKAYNEVDIMLDTYPFNGATITCEALWMGVPTISLVGESHISRVGSSILSRVGLESLVASTPQEYVAKAAALAGEPQTLARIRTSIRQRVAGSSLCDAKGFARNVEGAYRKMWRKWCSSKGLEAGGVIDLPEETRTERAPSSEQTVAKNGMLQFDISENNNLRFVVSKDSLPPSLLKANAAAELGHIEQATGLINDQTVEAVRQMAQEDPSRVDVMFTLAAIFNKTQQLDKAEEWYKKVLKRQPHPLVLFELGNICRNTGRLSEAVEHQRKAVGLSPDSVELQTTLAEYLIRMGQVREGIGLLRKAVDKAPDKVNHSKFLWHLHHQPELNQQMLFDEHKRWSSLHAPPGRAKASHDNMPAPDRRLRIGYISPDFCGHSVAFFFEPLLDEHNHEAVETYGYGNVSFQDEITERLKGKFDHYRNICGMKDEAVVRMIEQDRIDILVDLAGHTAGNRLLVMACKPAPVQVTYLGYPDTTGMEAIDYRLTDALAEGLKAQRFYTEELVYLPNGFLCYKPADFALPVSPPPVQRKGHITFGSFNC
jgi:predicted O-linked N-acetylglucosamine transferase (SPINDLY family)